MKYFAMSLAALVLVAGGASVDHWNGRAAPASAQAPTATSTVVPAVTATGTPIAPSTTVPSTQPDLSLTVTASPDPVMAGQILSYIVTVHNGGGGGAPQVWLTGQLPQGTSVQTLATGCSADPAAGTLRCQVAPLGPGQEAAFILHLNVTATGGTIGNRFAIDVEGFVNESDETNNVVDKIVLVTPSTQVPTPPVSPSPTTVAAATPAPTATEVPIPTPVPAPPPTPPSPPPAQLWVQVLGATPAVSAAGDVLWEAQPGEWYWVIAQDADWVLAAWELDPPEAAVWIQIDGRVALSTF